MSEYQDVNWNARMQISNLEVAGFSKEEMLIQSNFPFFQNCLYLAHYLKMSACTVPWILSEKTGRVYSASAEEALSHYLASRGVIERKIELGEEGREALLPLRELVTEVKSLGYDLTLEAGILFFENAGKKEREFREHALKHGLTASLPEISLAKQRIARFKQSSRR